MDNKNNKKGFDFDPIDLSSVLPLIKEGKARQKAITEKQKETGDAPEDQSEVVDDKIASLFQKMGKKGDFPSFSKQILEVNKILRLKYSSAQDIADVILKDFSLSTKLLKLVNSSFYSQFGQGGISSVSNAMVILGIDQVQHAAASLMLFEHMQANAQTDELKDITISTFMSGHMAKDIAGEKDLSDADEFQICAMFHNLGENLIVFYFPEKHKSIQEIAVRLRLNNNEAAKKVLGVTYKELGIGIAKEWGLPPNIIESMRGLPEEDSKPTRDKPSRGRMLGCISSFSNELTNIQLEPDFKTRKAAMKKLIGTYKTMLPMSVEDVGGLLSRTTKKFKTHSALLNINTEKSKILQNMSMNAALSKKKKVVKTPEKPVKKPVKVGNVNKLDHKAIQIRVYKAIVKINGQLQGNFSIGEVLTSILEIMHKEFLYTRVVICLKDANKNVLTARYGLGKNIDKFMKDFNFPISRGQDVFNRSLSKERDYSVDDMNLPKYNDLIPDWYRNLGVATGFDLYSIVLNNAPVGFFYADKEEGLDEPSFDQQNSMKKLRTLAEKAIRLKKSQAR